METANIKAAEPGRSGWLAVFAVATATFTMVTSEFLPIGLLGTIADDLHASDGSAGLMVTAPGLVAAVAAPVLARKAGNVDRRHLLICLTGLIALADTVVALGPNLPVILIGRLILGAALGGFWALAAPVGRRLVRERDGNRAIATILGGISIGSVAGVPLGTFIGQGLGWRVAFFVAAAATAGVLLFQAMVLPKIEAERHGDAPPLLSIFTVRTLRLAFGATALIVAGHFAAYTYLQPFLALGGGGEAAEITGLLTGFGIAGVLGTWLGERLASRDVRRSLLAVAIALAIAIGASLSLGSYLLPLVLAILLWGCAFGALPVCAQIWIHMGAPDRFEAGSAMLVTVFQIAVAAGAFIGGLAADSSFGVRAAFFVGVALSTTAAGLILRGKVAAAT
jgi:predicted MFS family arabinose efflux permease